MMGHGIDISYRPYVPSGYTDDLGIIADRNQWVPEQQPGWYVVSDFSTMHAIRKWLQENDMDYTEKGWTMILHDRNDVALFKLRWS